MSNFTIYFVINFRDAIKLGIDKLQKDDCETEQELLNVMDKKYKDGSLDLGPVFDVVLFHDGTHWVCLIDTSECGHLDQGVRLRPYRETGDFAPLTKEDRFHVSINVYEDGNVLQLVRISLYFQFIYYEHGMLNFRLECALLTVLTWHPLPPHIFPMPPRRMESLPELKSSPLPLAIPDFILWKLEQLSPEP